MWALFGKELRYFLLSPVGYVVMGVFFALNGGLVWFFLGNYNIIQAGFADLSAFFALSSWIFLFLIPAVTMRSISEERKTGMLQLLFTRPLSMWQIVLGKYFAVLAFLLLILLISTVYVYVLSGLALPAGNINVASIIGAYVATFLLCASFSAVGIWASSITENQVIAFVLATFVGFLLFYGIDELLQWLFPLNRLAFGFKQHFDNISRGVLDLRNIVYFLCVSAFFLSLSVYVLKLQKL